jgi:acetylornithine deacetylase/succinyl-diaminopimelate desuccinylase-like protein
MRLLALLLLILAPAAAQDRTEELLRKVDRAIEQESARVRAELVELVRKELGGRSAPAPAVAPPPPPAAGAATVEKAKELVTIDLLKKHAAYLASDELEGRAAGYPGNDKASEYISEVMKKHGLKAAGDDGTYFQRFRLGGKDTRNVVGMLEGTDPELKKEFLVIGAHFDHVGTADQRDYGRIPGSGDDKIWNGADDNGSGTTTVLGVVRAFGESGLRTRRSVLFILFSGEEAGLVGSRWYVNHPVAPLGQHVFMLNLDMVGRNGHKAIEIQGVGSAEGGLVKKAVEKGAAASGLKAKIEEQVTLVGGDSDHSSFRDKRIPYAFFWSGFHADYHKPSDHADKLAYDNMVRVGHTAIHILSEIGNGDERPKFSGQVPRGFNLPDLAEPPRPGRTLGVTVQELDDTECDGLKLEKTQGGLRVDALKDGSVASAAGVRTGDVVLALGGVKLGRGQTRETLRQAIAQKAKPGQEVEIVVLRGGERVTLKAKWTE